MYGPPSFPFSEGYESPPGRSSLFRHVSLHEEFARFKIPLEEVLKATNNFADENIIGQGGFGRVYKGSLVWSGQQTVIAARRLHYKYGQGDLEFWQEISMLSDLKHENLVCFLGFCNEKGEKIIINKHEIHESLEKYLKDSNLKWIQRLQICVGIARAMNYIHFDVGHNYSVIHRNIKSSKILLDDNWEPKLSGFEHALRNTSDRRHRLLLAEVVGTIGYVDPTYEKTGFVTHKSDVYSFGVVLFEILCGRRAFIPDDQEQGSPQLAKQDSKNEKLDVETQFHNSIDNNNILASSSNNITTPLIDYVEDYLSIDIQLPTLRRLPSITCLPYSFDGGLPLSDGLPSIFNDGRQSSFVDELPSSFNDGLSQSSGDIHSVETYSSKRQFLALQPLYTMKRIEKYVHIRKEGLLALLAKSCYDDKSLDDMIDPSLLEQIDPESFQIFSDTAYSCLKEQRAQRPNIDQIVRNLERALTLQMRRENIDQSRVAGNVEGTESSNR